ncbi:MAG: MFS transporter [Novosphingobium sp.]
MNEHAGPPANHKSIFWISVLALFTAAFSNAARVGASGAIKSELFDAHDAAHAGELIGATLGNSFLGFALSLLVISPLLDTFGAKRVILFASACFIVGPAITLLGANSSNFGSMQTLLNIGMVIWGFGWGATEGSINPLTTTIYPGDKTGKLNTLHAWWPAGIIVGGLLSYLLVDRGLVDWRYLIAASMIPGLIFGIWAMGHRFPQTESTAKGVSFSEMLAEPFKHISFWAFFAIMLCTASTELGPGQWVDVALSKTVGMSGILLLVYVSAIMFIARHFAGSLEHKFSDIGLLWLCSIPASIGLYLLSTANSPFTALVAATLWAIGVCFMWPTMLAAVARRYPRSGSWGIGLIGFAGALAIYFILPRIGAIYDRAMSSASGNAEAFAAAQSFQTVAILPLGLFVIFGVVWLLERGRNTK